MLGIIRRLFSFQDWDNNHPGAPPPGDMLDASFDAQDNKINELLTLLEAIRRPDGLIQNALVSRDSLDPEFLPWLTAKLGKSTLTAAEKAESAASEALSAGNSARIAAETAQSAQKSAEDAQLQILDAKNAVLGQILAIKSRTEEIFAAVTATEAELLTMDEDWQTSRAEAEAWALSSALWAEHMPDTLPDNAVKIMDITGDHWSSRWWANRADNAFGRLTDLYLGAWPDPPTTNLEGGPIETGSIYYDTDEHQPYVWDGANWVPFWTPGRSVSSGLWYQAAAGQTVFPFSVPDQNGNTFSFDSVHPEGSEVHLNGIRLTPNYGASAEADYSINTTTSTLTMNRPLRLGDIVGVTLLLPVEELAPGAATVWALKLNEAVDGVRVTFSLAPKSVSGPIVSVSRAETLLVSLDGAVQEPGYAYTAIDNQITFTTAPTIDQRLFLTWFESAPASAAAAVTYGYTFDAGVSEPPGNQQIRDNSADPAAVTLIWLRSLDADGADVSNVLRNINAAHRIYVQEKADSTHWQRYDVTGQAVEKTGYFEIPVVWTSGSGLPLTDNRVVGIVFTEKPPVAAPLPAEVP